MEVRAVSKYVRISPKKVQEIIHLLPGKQVDVALNSLSVMPHKAARILYKVTKSAVANAENNFNLDRKDLIVSKAFADKGPSMKRFTPRAYGRAFPILKRTSHITVVVATAESKQKGGKQ
ncbi:ribosomal protein L22 [Thermodesulfobium narugense DSM 14796]|uniref:Large ribosomal subunit protein uL22 n=1 Tax=Thermodesulfobium narugense DSM 14796 TaxID=747365 RepID=M1E7U5_9BACT|nr:50S ribosomal protein L22 [Thermodesulfobium narugense]AEE14149.1 ribosomal protein L22 [Thermodesulfobium narugense DSM 14796]